MYGHFDKCPLIISTPLFGLVSYGCFQKQWYPQIIHFNRVFHYKPSILGYPYFWKHPYHDPLQVVFFFEKAEVFGVFRAVPEMFDAIGIVPWTLGTLERKWGQNRGLTKQPGWF